MEITVANKHTKELATIDIGPVSIQTESCKKEKPFEWRHISAEDLLSNYVYIDTEAIVRDYVQNNQFD